MIQYMQENIHDNIHTASIVSGKKCPNNILPNFKEAKKNFLMLYIDFVKETFLFLIYFEFDLKKNEFTKLVKNLLKR